MRGCQYLIRLLRLTATEKYYQLFLDSSSVELDCYMPRFVRTRLWLKFFFPHFVKSLVTQTIRQWLECVSWWWALMDMPSTDISPMIAIYAQ
jgi:hypothetical protein